MEYIAGIGGANMDIHGRSDAPLVMRDSNPGHLHMSMGGVCRNICENLVRLGERVSLVSVVGNDPNGRTLMEGCRALGINMDHVRMMEEARTSSYISLMDSDGDMLVAMSDMSIIKHLDERLVEENRTVLNQAELVVCDGNLSGRTLDALARLCDRPLYLDPVSTAWARELRPYIGRFHTVKPNRMELEALTDCPCATEAELAMACDRLRGLGVQRVFVSLGSEGMYYRGPEGGLLRRSRPYPHLVNATGAGDASMAGIIYATRQGWDAERVLYAAMAAGMCAIASEDTINPEMSPQKLEEIMKGYLI